MIVMYCSVVQLVSSYLSNEFMFKMNQYCYRIHNYSFLRYVASNYKVMWLLSCMVYSDGCACRGKYHGTAVISNDHKCFGHMHSVLGLNLE